MPFFDLLKQWADKTPLVHYLDRHYLSIKLNYEELDLPEQNPTLINKGITKNVEFLWYTHGKCKIVLDNTEEIIVQISFQSEVILAHIFYPDLIKQKQLLNEDHMVFVIKTRAPISGEHCLFHEIRFFRKAI